MGRARGHARLCSSQRRGILVWKPPFQWGKIYSKFWVSSQNLMLVTKIVCWGLSYIYLLSYPPPRGKIKGLRGVRFSCHVSDLKYISLIFWWMLVGNCWLITKAIFRKIRLILALVSSSQSTLQRERRKREREPLVVKCKWWPRAWLASRGFTPVPHLLLFGPGSDLCKRLWRVSLCSR